MRTSLTETIGSTPRRRLRLAGIVMILLCAWAGQGRAQVDSRADTLSSVVVAIPGSEDAPLHVGECIRASLENNDDLQAERSRMGELHGQKTQAKADGLPTLDIVGRWDRGRDPSFAFDSTFSGGGGGGNPIDTGDAGFDSLFTTAVGQLFGGEGGSFIPAPEDIPAQTFWRASAQVFWELHPTRVIYAVKAANIALDQQSLNIRDLENRTVEGTLRLYYEVLANQALAQSVAAEVEARREFLDITRRRYFLDMATGLDTLQARVQMMNLLPTQRRAELEVRNAGRSLNTQMGRDPSTPLALHVDFMLETDALDEELAVALVEQRPDVQRARMQEEYLHRERDVMKSELHPYLVANGSYGYVTREVDDWLDRGHDFWSAGVGLTIPIFDGLLTKGRVQQREAAIRRTQYEIRGIRRRAEEEIRLAVDELGIARENLQVALLNRDQAEKALRQTNRRYELGKAGYLDVLNAQAARFTARSNLIQAYYDVLVGTAVLKRSVGMNPTQPLAAMKESTP